MVDKRLLKEAIRIKYYICLVTVFGVCTGLLTVMQSKTLATIVNGVFTRHFILPQVWTQMLLLLVFMLLRAVLVWMGEVYSKRGAGEIKHDLRQRLLVSLIAAGPIPLKDEKSGELTNLLMDGVETLDAYFSEYLPQLAVSVLTPVLILLFVFPVDVLTGTIMAVTAPLIPVFMILIGQWAKALTQSQWEALSRMGGHFLDVLRGLNTLKVFGRSKSQENVIFRISENFRETTMGVLRVSFLSALVLELAATLSTAVIAVTLGVRLVYGKIPFEQAFFLLVVAPEYYQPLRQLGAKFHAGIGGKTAANRIFEVLETGNGLGGEAKCENPGDPGPIPGGEIHFEFNRVSYRYEGAETKALDGISFEMKPGQKTALVGASGSGKSTLVSMLMGFLYPQGGEILINGISIKNFETSQWRERISFVSQKPYLFYGTIEENIRIGKPGADMEEVKKAAIQAGADEFIEQQPHGYATNIGEAGVRLSGGQLQRIAIARTFLKNAPVLILDEATSAQDPETEMQIRKTLENLAVGRTVLVIAHNMVTAKWADQIVVLENGRLVEKGAHQELEKQGGVYGKLLHFWEGAV